jgi:glycine betaine/choline ABC-type transport system substrate-binding protein
VLSGGIVVGLSAGSASAGHSGDASSSTAALLSPPVVTTVAAQSIPGTSLPGDNRPAVTLGDMNTPEQFILGQLYELALQQRGYSITLSLNVGATATAVRALKDRTLDLYPEYLGEWNSRVARLHHRFESLTASYRAGSAYATQHGLVLLKPTPFSDTWGLIVTAQYAKENQIRSIADLTRGTGIAIGVPAQFETSPDGLAVLRSAYHLQPGFVQGINVGAQYRWVWSGNVQAAWAMTTDPELAGPRYRLLLDPKHVFGFGNVVPVTTPGVLRAEGPIFRDTINRVDALLTTRAIRGLNKEYAAGHNPTAIAREFLQANGILPPSQFAPVVDTSTDPTVSGGGSG